jgi:hypothetical protein
MGVEYFDQLVLIKLNVSDIFFKNAISRYLLSLYFWILSQSLELPVPHSQAGAWERVNIYEEGELNEHTTCKNFLQAYQADTKDSA